MLCHMNILCIVPLTHLFDGVHCAKLTTNRRQADQVGFIIWLWLDVLVICAGTIINLFVEW